MKKRRKNDSVDDWTLQKRLGEGGNALVWTASKDETPLVALKILKTLDCNSEQFKRFNQEIKTHIYLEDDLGVMPMLNYSLPDNPTFDKPAWLAMPIANNSKDYFDNDSTLFEIVEFVMKVSRTLLLCAEKDVYHRDIKPANLYVLNKDSIIGDFGLVHIPGREALTKPGRKFGPIFYLPDELLNDAESANPASVDVFMLAKTLWVLASGQNYPPQGQILTMNKLSNLSLYWNDPKCFMLDEIIERCTSVNPDDRPSMNEFSKELSAWLTYDECILHSKPDLAIVGARLKPLVRSYNSVVNQSIVNVKEVERLQNVIEKELSNMASLIAEQTELEVKITQDNHINTVVKHPDTYHDYNSYGPSVNIVAEAGPHGKVDCGFFVTGVGFKSSSNMKTISLVGAHAIRGVGEKLLWSKQVDIIPRSAYEVKAISEIIEALHQSLSTSLTEYADHLSKTEFNK